MRTMRHRQAIKNNSILALGLLVFLAVVLTTLAQAAEPPFATHSSTSWLLPNGVHFAEHNGLYSMRLQGTVGGRGWSTGSDSANGVDMSLGLGFQDDRAGVTSTPVRDFRGLQSGLQPVMFNGPQLFMSVGHRW